jgi:hypothetical protein
MRMRSEFFDDLFTSRFKEITGKELKIEEIEMSTWIKGLSFECDGKITKLSEDSFFEINREVLNACDLKLKQHDHFNFKEYWFREILNYFGYDYFNIMERIKLKSHLKK